MAKTEGSNTLHLLLAVAGTILTTLAWMVAPDASIPAKIAIPTGAALAVAIAWLTVSFLGAQKQSRLQLPKVLRVVNQTPGASVPMYVLLVEPSPLFGHDHGVSIYETQEGFEVLVAFGRVLNVQQDQRIQIQVIDTVEGQDETMDALLTNDHSRLARTIVKPQIPLRYSGRGDLRK